jgi:hypothetical protein
MGLAGSFFGGSGDILIKVGADVGGAVAGLGDVKGALADTQTTGQKVQAGIRSAAVPAAAALTGLAAAGLACVKSAAAAQESQSKLNDQIKRSTGASDEAIKSTNDWVGAYGKQVAMTKGELNPALANLVRATGDVAEAQKLLVISTDIAAATGKDLASVSGAVGKAYNGSAGALKRLVPSISDAAIKSKDWAQIQKELNKQVGGAAAESAKTTEGQYRSLENSMKGLQVSIGMALLPAFQKLIDVMGPLANLAKAHGDAVAYLGIAVAGGAAAILVINAAMSAAAAISAAYGAAQAVLGSQIVITTAKTIAQAAATVASRAVFLAVRGATIAWTAAQWLLNAALTANPIGLVVAAVVALGVALVIAYRHSATFRQIVASAFQVVRQYGVLMLGPIGLYIKMIQLAWEHSQTFRDIVVAAFNAVKGAIQAVIDLVRNIHWPSAPSWLNKIPHGMTATGGYAYGMPTPVWAGPGLAAETGAGMVVHVSVSGAIDPEATAIQIRRILQRYDRRRGRRPLGGEAPES